MSNILEYPQNGKSFTYIETDGVKYKVLFMIHIFSINFSTSSLNPCELIIWSKE